MIGSRVRSAAPSVYKDLFSNARIFMNNKMKQHSTSHLTIPSTAKCINCSMKLKEGNGSKFSTNLHETVLLYSLWSYFSFNIWPAFQTISNFSFLNPTDAITDPKPGERANSSGSSFEIKKAKAGRRRDRSTTVEVSKAPLRSLL